MKNIQTYQNQISKTSKVASLIHQIFSFKINSQIQLVRWFWRFLKQKVPINYDLFIQYFAFVTQFSIYSKLMSKNIERHRNKCQMCYSETGRLIMDCMCILCEGCFTKRNRQFDACIICEKKTKHIYIDTKDQKHTSKVSFLFHNIGINLSQCIEAYNFQISLDAKYCKFLEKQLMRHKEAISQLKQQNPHLEAYFINKLSSKPKPNVKYSSEYLPNHAPSYHQNYQERVNHQNNLNTSRSLSNQGTHLQHQMSIEGQRVKGHYQERNYSGKVNYKLPNMNYNTALRSSHRTMKDQQNSYYRR